MDNKTGKPSSQTGRYFKYAIGEIILVVIGILIALAINNWNQNKMVEKRISAYLWDIKQNLEDEIKQANLVIEFYDKRDSLLRLVILDKIKKDDFASDCGDHCPQFAILNWNYMDINQNAYKNLLLISSDIPNNYRDVFTELSTLYEVQGKSLAVRKSKLEDKMRVFSDYLRDTKVWFHKLFMGSYLDEEMTTYFLEDLFYKNYVLEYFDDARKLSMATANYKEQAEIVLSYLEELDLQ